MILGRFWVDRGHPRVCAPAPLLERSGPPVGEAAALETHVLYKNHQFSGVAVFQLSCAICRSPWSRLKRILRGFKRFLGFNPLPPPNPPKPPYPPGVTPPNPPGLPPPDPPGLWGWGAFLILGVKFSLQVLFLFLGLGVRWILRWILRGILRGSSGGSPGWNLVPRPTSAPGWNPGVPGPQAQNQNKTP